MAFSRDFDFQLLNGQVVKNFSFNTGYWSGSYGTYGYFLEPISKDSTFKLDKFLLQSQYDEFINFTNYTTGWQYEQHTSYDGELIYDNEITSNTSLADMQNYGKKYLAYVDMIFATKFKNVKYFKLNKYNRLYFALYPDVPNNRVYIFYGLVSIQRIEYLNGHYSFRGQRYNTEDMIDSEYPTGKLIYNKNVTYFFAHASASTGFLIIGKSDSVKPDNNRNGYNFYDDTHQFVLMNGLTDFYNMSVGNLTGNLSLPLNNNTYANVELNVQRKNWDSKAVDGFPYTCRALTDKRIGQLKNYVEYVYIDNVLEFGSAIDDSKRPANAGGSSGTGGGEGSFDDSSDPIGVPSLPNGNIFASGLVTLFAPTDLQLSAFGEYLWSDSILDIVDILGKFYAHPKDYVFGLNAVPVSLQHGPSKVVRMGVSTTGVSMDTLVSQFVQLDCGTINIEEYWGNALDYSGTDISIYLPYVGYQRLNTSQFMSNDINVVYNIDVVSGNSVACVSCIKDGVNYLLDQFNANVVQNIPLSSNDFNNTITSLMTTAGACAIGGVSAKLGAATMLASGFASNGVYNQGGQMGSTWGLLGYEKPYLIIERINQSLPSSYQKFNGFPCNITCRLNELSGFTIVDKIHLDNVICTDQEKKMLESILKNGVIL